MQQLIKDGRLIDDHWQLIAEKQAEAFTPEPQVCYLLPLPLWQQLAPQFEGFSTRPGLWLDGDQELDCAESLFAQVAVIAVRFSAFTDGSGFSTASLLRELYGFSGELRAIGALLIDQYPYLQRCGFDSIALNPEQNPEQALQFRQNSQFTYQGSVQEPRTPFSRRYGS